MKKRSEQWIPILMLSVMLAVCMIPSAALAQSHEPSNGHKHADIDIYSVPAEEDGLEAAETYAAKLDPRGETWYQNNMQVRDQGLTEMCWAFSAAAAARISYAKERYQSTGSTASIDMLSPTHLAYFFYNRANDPLDNTAKDRNVGKNWIEEGGACYWTMQHLATWSGMETEAKVPFITKWNQEKQDYEYAGPTSYPAELAYDDSLIIENSVCYVDCDVDTLKGMLTKYGAAVVSTELGAEGSAERYLNNKINYYNPTFTKNVHEVTVVGWDDSYPADRFKGMNAKGKYVQPKNPGAWIVLNSWGEAWGENGYYYVSYESKDLLSDGICSFDMQPVDSAKANYQYDGNADSNSVKMLRGERAANVFTAKKRIRLSQAAFTTWNAGPGETRYTVDVFTGLADPKDPLSGINASTTEITTDSPGYKSFSLREPVTVDAEETFAIVVTFHAKQTQFGDEQNSKNYKAEISPGQSFYREGSSDIWNDAANDDIPFCFRIKGIADPMTAPCQHGNYVSTGEVHEATVNEEGYTVYKCSKCGHKIKDDIQPMLNQNPAKTSITKVTAAKKAFTVKWKKDSELLHKKHITGYKVRYSLKSSMSGAKTVTVKGWTKTSKKVTGLKSGKKYYVQVQTYFNDDTGNYASDWSGKKAVKTK